MANQQHKPFSRTELKILVYNRIKRGMSYENAVKDVHNQIQTCNENHKKHEAKEKEDQENKEDQTNKTFKEEFAKLTKRK
jgi:hypothetical protein